MVVTVHHLDKSRSHRIVWLLEEIGMPYEIKKYQRTPQASAPRELRQVHPLGKSPVITDGDRTIAETGAIIKYLVSKYAPHLAPPEDADENLQMRYTYWLHFSEGSAIPPYQHALVLSMAGRSAPYYVQWIAAYIVNSMDSYYFEPLFKRHMDFMEMELAKNEEDWFVRDFSAADVIMSFVVELANLRRGLEEYPRLKRFLAAVQERPAYKRAVKKAGWPVPRKW